MSCLVTQVMTGFHGEGTAPVSRARFFGQIGGEKLLAWHCLSEMALGKNSPEHFAYDKYAYN